MVRTSCPTARPAHATPHFSFRPYRVAASVVPIPNRRCADANCALMSAVLADRTSAARDDVAKRPRKHASQRRTRHLLERDVPSIAVAAAARATASAAAAPVQPSPPPPDPPPEAPPGPPPRPLRLIMRSLPLSLTVVRASHHRLSSEMLGLAHIGLWAQWVPYRYR